ncbi:hypothetical protein BOZ38_RS24850, partial [Escherichia coli]
EKQLWTETTWRQSLRGAGFRNLSLDMTIIVRSNPSKAAILEEFLHGTQEKLGIAEKLGRYGLGSAETHVKDFMIRHKKMLGLSDEDVAILKILKDKGL